MTASCERSHLAELVNAELIRLQSVTTAALSKFDGTVSDAICSVGGSFPVEGFSCAPGPSADGLPDQALVSFVVRPAFLHTPEESY